MRNIRTPSTRHYSKSLHRNYPGGRYLADGGHAYGFGRPVVRTCQRCNKDFNVYAGRQRKFCFDCEAEMSKPKPCEYCGGLIHRDTRKLSSFLKVRYCSRACASKGSRDGKKE